MNRNIMKGFALLLSVLLILSMFAGCSNKPAQPAPEPSGTVTPAPAEEKEPEPASSGQEPENEPEPETEPEPEEPAPAGPFSPDGSVIFDKDGVRVTTAGLDMDPTTMDPEPIIWVDVENSSSDDAYLGVSYGAVNGIMASVLLVEFTEEEDGSTSASYLDSVVVPANSNDRFALGYYDPILPGADVDTLSEMEFCFTMAEDEYFWPNYSSDPVVILSGEPVVQPDIASLGTVVVDNDTLRIVVGEQDYSDWFGPEIDVYVENKSDRYIRILPDTAEAEGASCDYIYYDATVWPGKIDAKTMSFDDELRELRGFETISLTLLSFEAESEDALADAEPSVIGPVTVTYPPQIWGEFESEGIRMEIRPKFNSRVTVTVPEESENGELFSVAETKSAEAGGYEGAGWLFSIGKVSREKLHELLCYDTGYMDVFAKDADGNYYVYYHPTDVRYERETVEQMREDIAEWSMVCEWASEMPRNIQEMNNLESVSFGSSEVNMYVARAAWMNPGDNTISTTEYGPLKLSGTDSTPFAEFILKGEFYETDPEDTPDGEYVVLNLPDENVRLDFFRAEGGYVRLVSEYGEQLYRAIWEDDDISYSEAMLGWYYAAAVSAGVRPEDDRVQSYCGQWHEKTAGRGMMSISQSVAPGKVDIKVVWPESAAVIDTWTMVAAVNEDGTLTYRNGWFTSIEYTEDGDTLSVDNDWALSGWFEPNADQELIWRNEKGSGVEDSVFVR
ncbi:MAG: hypothetical protein J6P31_03535 [Oscillospiraceae bacterium]|nr:hypothetical protein [Oscillospiraceae bacterium]